MTTLTSAGLLQHTRVPNSPRVHLLGELESRVTVYSQQVRALNLVYALFEQGQLAKGAEVAIVGGGVAGLTAAAAAASKGCKVTLLEKKPDLLHLQSLCTKRWLHPHIYDWPEPDALRDDTDDLPFLRWKAATAGEVVEQIRADWSVVRQRLSDSIRVELNVSDVAIPPVAGDSMQRLTWNPGMGRAEVAAVILAVGFGVEKTISPLPEHSYWRDDDLDQLDTGTPRSVLISGYGDGGLTDLLRASIKGFRHDNIVRDFKLDLPNSSAQGITGRLQEIERVATSLTAESQAKFLTDEYRKLDDLSKLVDAELRKRSTGRKVVLNGPGHDPITSRASMLNRFLASRVLILDLATNKAGTIAPGGVTQVGSRWRVTFDDERVQEFDKVIIRHGAKPALATDFPAIWKASTPLAHRNALDQTRKRIWPDGWYDSKESDASSPPSCGGVERNDHQQPQPNFQSTDSTIDLLLVTALREEAQAVGAVMAPVATKTKERDSIKIPVTDGAIALGEFVSDDDLDHCVYVAAIVYTLKEAKARLRAHIERVSRQPAIVHEAQDASINLRKRGYKADSVLGRSASRFRSS